MRITLLLVLLVVIASCSSSKVIVDYDLKTDFSKYKTYQFYEDAGKELNDFDIKRFTSAIGKQLDSINFKQSKAPDFYINFYSTKRTLSRNAVGVGVGGPYNGGISISTDFLFGMSKIEETITLEFVDAVTDLLFWQGRLTVKVKEKIKPEQREIWVNEMVNKILRKLPR